MRRNVTVVATGVAAAVAWLGAPAFAMGSGSPDGGAPAFETVVHAAESEPPPGDGTPDEVLTASEIARTGAASVPELLSEWLGGALADEQGNGVQLDLSMRGFTASPVSGVSQGLAVYLDGVRVNEPGAGEVDLDLIPLEDLERIEIVRGPSALAGSSALGGVVKLYTRRGGEGGGGGPLDAEAAAGFGSFGRQGYGLRAGGREDPFDWWVSVRSSRSDGFRQQSGVDGSQAFAKLGVRRGGVDAWLSFQHRVERAGQAGSLPESVLATDRSANFTPGDFFAPQLDQLIAGATFELPASIHLDATAYARRLSVEQFNAGLADADTRLFEDALSAGASAQAGGQRSFGPVTASWQLGVEYAHHAVAVRVFDEQNATSLPECLAAGVEDCSQPILESDVRDAQDGAGAGALLGATSTFGPVKVGLNGALRAAWTRHDVDDRDPASPGEASGRVEYRSLTPAVAAWANAGPATLELRYAGGIRTPELLELTCADPEAPCVGLQAGVAPDTSLVALRPVVARELELGARFGRWRGWEVSGSLFHIDVQDDLFSVAPAGTTRLYFQNVGPTRREGAELSVHGRIAGALTVDAAYAFTRAVFLTDLTLASPRIPGALEQVPAGAQLPLVPLHRAAVQLRARVAWDLWAELHLSATSAQFLRGDEANTQPPLRPYALAGVGLRWERGAFGAGVRAQNILGARYETFGTFAPNARVEGAPIERFLTPGAPFSVTADLSVQVPWR
jgi:iron complex outermembrane recepter protein